MNEEIEERVAEIRKYIKKYQLDGYIISSSDEYLSEYVPDTDNRLQFISGFTGSNGLLIILEENMLFFTDGRYIKQANNQLDGNYFKIFDQKFLSNFNFKNYILHNQVIGYDPKLFTKEFLHFFDDINILPISTNLVDLIWKDKPSGACSKIFDYPIEFAGVSYENKIKKIHDLLREQDAIGIVISEPESVCWLLNIRAHDVEYSPLLLAYCLVVEDEIILFADDKRADRQIKSVKQDIRFEDKKNFNKIIEKYANEGRILYSAENCNSYIEDFLIARGARNIKNPISLSKSIKNNIELNHIINSHIEDAVAVCELLAFIENDDSISNYTEYSLGKKLSKLRAGRNNYVMDSFPAIIGFRENGAIIHYRAEEKYSKQLSESGMLLIDSGGQYYGATTDITRTIYISRSNNIYDVPNIPTKDQIENYTNVLKGCLSLASSRFPEKIITGANLDVLARQYLWNSGMDYPHGTGHGVGSYLQVHEGPCGISPRAHNVILQKNMVMSNEPGFYISGEYGIRIENLIYVKKSQYDGFLEFEELTLVPYSKKLINRSILSKSELEQISNYYKKIDDKVKPLLSNQAKRWLELEVENFI